MRYEDYIWDILDAIEALDEAMERQGETDKRPLLLRAKQQMEELL